MLLYKKEVDKIITESINSLSGDIVVKIKFLLGLLDSDDWTLIVKAQSLIEKIVTDIIIAKTEESHLKKFLERLPLSDEEIGKLRIVKDYDLFSSSQRKFIRKLSEIRNKLVHNFEYVNFDFANYIESLGPNQKEWYETITWFAEDENSKKQWVLASKKFPIIVLWYSIYFLVVSITIDEKQYQSISKINEMASLTVEKLLKTNDELNDDNKDNVK